MKDVVEDPNGQCEEEGDRRIRQQPEQSVMEVAEDPKGQYEEEEVERQIPQQLLEQGRRMR